MHEFRTTRRIEFSDTDMAGIVHFSRFFVFMESAEHQFLNAIGTSVSLDQDGDTIGWPRLSASCEFLRPVRFEDELEIRVRVGRKGNKSMTYGFEFKLEDEVVARGELTSACCLLRPGQRPKPVDIPKAIADRLEEAPK